MREWLKGASLPRDPDLKADLTALRYKYKGGEVLLEDKAEAKSRGMKSPDRADSLALTFAIPTMPEQRVETLPAFVNPDSSMGMLA
jgi:phage terminase large subunit